MERVIKELENVRSAPDADAVHDLRVAIRRCRSLAAVMEEVDPDPSWHRMRKVGRKIFRQLGSLRDVQVLHEWTLRLGSETDALRQKLLSHFETQEQELRESALKVAAKFDEKAWKQLERRLRSRARLVTPDGLAAECLALERLESAKGLHIVALRTEKQGPWHELRIGVKRFRYTVESLLPTRHGMWGGNLKRMQDLLGEVHDLDVLQETIELENGPQFGEARASWLERIAEERFERLEAYRQLAVSRERVWQEWRAGLPQDRRLEQAALARLRATARAVMGTSRRARQISRLATRLYDSLARVEAAPLFAEKRNRKVMRAASALHAIGLRLDPASPQKAARNFLLNMELPAAWSRAEWRLLASAVRYHRGTEPKEKHKPFSELPEEDQRALRGLAGVLRLARGLRKCGVVTTAGIRVERSVDAIIVHVPGLQDTADAAARLAAAKHLLEGVLDLPLLLKRAAILSGVLQLPRRTEALDRAAQASD
jgi:CHAD domain-containing protein